MFFTQQKQMPWPQFKSKGKWQDLLLLGSGTERKKITLTYQTLEKFSHSQVEE